MANYSFEHLETRIAHAKALHGNYIRDLELRYIQRKLARANRDIPVVAFCGYGRAGKDTAAEYFCRRLELPYVGSSSTIVLPIIASAVDAPEEQVWQERHANREFWVEACHAVRRTDLTVLCRLALGSGDVLIGPRGRMELFRAVEERVVDYTVWITNDRARSDPTVEYTEGDCHLTLANHGSHFELYAKIDRLIEMLRTQSFLGVMHVEGERQGTPA
jgi:hypothetical protein